MDPVRVLFGVLPNIENQIRSLVDPRIHAHYCSTLAEAHAVLAQGVDLVVAGVQFDEFQMLRLLEDLKANPETANLPFIVVCAADCPPIIQNSLSSFLAAVKSLRAYGPIDYRGYRAQFGELLATKKLLDECVEIYQSHFPRQERGIEHMRGSPRVVTGYSGV